MTQNNDSRSRQLNNIKRMSSMQVLKRKSTKGKMLGDVLQISENIINADSTIIHKDNDSKDARTYTLLQQRNELIRNIRNRTAPIRTVSASPVNLLSHSIATYDDDNMHPIKTI